MNRRSLHWLIFAFAVINASLYSCFLPLWEGFDEPFHYSYVECLAEGHLPVLGRAKVPLEIYASFASAPLSRFLSGSTGGHSFEQWFKLPLRQRKTLAARTVDPALRSAPSELGNYEAQQAPLAYALLVPLDLALENVQLRWRVLVLRLFGSILAVVLVYFGIRKLCSLVQVRGVFEAAAMACIFGSQMLWATVAHIGNDSLAVPLTLLFIVWLGIAVTDNGSRDLLILAGLFSAGLLTKAYFLAFAPVFLACVGYQFFRHRMHLTSLIALLIPAAIAGPWYLRNENLYGSFSGTQQAVAGIGVLQAFSAVPHIPWATSTLAFLHWSLWTGNWSFLSFSKATLNVELLLLGAALIVYSLRIRAFSVAEWWGLSACICFLAALAYQTCVTYVHTNGVSLFAEPWYWQGVVCFVWVLAFRGLALEQKLGRELAIALSAVSAWIAAITYLAKLFPLYGEGFERATLIRVWKWWIAHPTEDLGTVTLASPTVLYVLLIVLIGVLAAQTALILSGLVSRSKENQAG